MLQQNQVFDIYEGEEFETWIKDGYPPDAARTIIESKPGPLPHKPSGTEFWWACLLPDTAASAGIGSCTRRQDSVLVGR